MPMFEVDTSGPSVTAVRFSNGTITNRDVAVKSYVNQSDKKRKIVTAKVDGISYVGQNFGDGNRFPDVDCDYYMGIHDKSTGKIRVVPASLIQMNPWFRDEANVDAQLQENAQTYNEKLTVLTSGFGSGKSQRMVEKKLREKLSDDVVTATALSMVDSAPAESLEVQVMAESDVIPPHNKDAQTPDEVYTLRDLVTRDVLNSLTEAADVFTSAKKIDVAALKADKKFFSFILSRVQILSSHPDARLLQGQCLTYLQYIMEMFLMKASDLRTKFPLPKEWPQTVRDYLLRLFTMEIKEPGKPFRRTLPGHKKDLMLAHILVLCLKMSEYSLDLTPLVEDLKNPVRKLINLANSLGCQVKKSKRGTQDVYTAVLKVPLTFPKVNKGKGAKKKPT